MTVRVRHTATPLYPGSFYPEEGRPVEISDASSGTALDAVPDDGRWFAVEVATHVEKRYASSAGDEMWVPSNSSDRYRIYIGELLTSDDVRALPGDHTILLSNMQSNGWDPIVRTRRGNFQPLEEGDVVIG